MHSSGGRAMDPVEAFKVLARAAGPRAKAAPPAKFVKKMDEIPSVELSPSDPCRMALMLSEKALIGKFTGLWPNPKAVDQWIAERWSSLAPSHISLCAAGRGYFVFIFENKEERDLIFRSGPYFMGSRGLFLAPWSLDFNPEAEITAAPVWVRLPHLPLHLWGKSSLADIGNKLGRFLDSAEPKGDQFTCARICVEVNLEKGLPEALHLTLGEWSHIQELDYEHIPFKCLRCHVYGHFAKSCPKAPVTVAPPPANGADFQPVANRRRAPRKKDSKSEVPTAEESTPANKNRFEALQELDDQDPEATVAVEEMLELGSGQEKEAPAAEGVSKVRIPPGTVEDPTPESLGPKKDPIDLGGETSA